MSWQQEQDYRRWAERWLSGEDRSAYSADLAAHSAAASAYSAYSAAHSADIDLIALAKEACS